MKKLLYSAVGLVTALSGFAGSANAWVVHYRVRVVFHRPVYRAVVRWHTPVGGPIADPDGEPVGTEYVIGGGRSGSGVSVGGSGTGSGEIGAGSRERNHRGSRSEDGPDDRHRRDGGEGRREPHSEGRSGGAARHEGHGGVMHASRSPGGRHGRR
jgi:hypothetical protein